MSRHFLKHSGHLRSFIDAELFRSKMATLEHPDNRYVSEGQLYSEERVASSALNLKSVNEDIFLTDALLEVYPDLYFIALTRDGYALCDGYIRRGMSASQAGRIYRKIAEKMEDYSKSLPKFKLVKFEDVLCDPFGMAKQLYEFANLTPATTDRLRLKSKKVMSSDGDHKSQFGHEKKKYWFTSDTIDQIIVPDINRTQADRLTAGDKKRF